MLRAGLLGDEIKGRAHLDGAFERSRHRAVIGVHLMHARDDLALLLGRAERVVDENPPEHQHMAVELDLAGDRGRETSA